jgi:hypothetical protein
MFRVAEALRRTLLGARVPGARQARRRPVRVRVRVRCARRARRARRVPEPGLRRPGRTPVQ